MYGAVDGVLRLVFTLSGNESRSKGGNSPLIEAKCCAMRSEDCLADRFSFRCSGKVNYVLSVQSPG